MKSQAELVLIPNVIAEGAEEKSITPFFRARIKNIRFFLAEDVRTARRFLSRLKIFKQIEDLHFEVLNKDTNPAELEAMFKPIASGESIGIISESGCPGVADPGALAVEYAHKNKIRVVPLVGPSSILMALMASGMNGQRFAFHGYLPIDGREMVAEIKRLEKESRSKDQTQIFIETPYRNNQLLGALIKSLQSSTRLCIALDLTGTDEMIKTETVATWRRSLPKLSKLPAIFLFHTA